MNEIIVLLIGVGVGTRFAEEIRKTVPALDPNKPTTTPPTAQ